MQLTYRGQHYTATNTTIPTVKIGLQATYRGNTYPLQRSAVNSLASPNLRYRGIPYPQNSETQTPVLNRTLSTALS